MASSPSPSPLASLIRYLLNVNLRTKVLGVTIAMNLLTVILLTWISSAKIQRVYLDQLALRGTTLTESLVTALEPAMLDKNPVKAAAILNDVKNVPSLAYAVAVDPAGRKVAQISHIPVPETLANLHPLVPGQDGVDSARIDVLGRAVLDIFHPLLQGAVGAVHIGMDMGAAKQEVRLLILHGALAALAVVAFGTLALWILLGILINPINRLAEATRRIVEQGDLSHEFSFSGDDEVARLGRNFQQMVVKLREIPRRLEASIQLLGETVRQLDQATLDQGDTVVQQASSLHETQVTAEEIRQVSRNAAEQAHGILATARDADTVSAQGEAAVFRSLSSMNEVKEQIVRTSARINELHQHMVHVKDIADTVKDLADQSNVLALNAAIEAMRSGEHGKGFALVAREIRRLADQSIKATNQVREILDGVAKSLNETVDMAGRGARRVETEMEEIKRSGENLNELAGMVRTTAGSVSQIATAVTQQDSGISQIFEAVTRQSKMMDRTQKQLEGVRHSLEQLKSVSATLGQMVHEFGQ